MRKLNTEVIICSFEELNKVFKESLTDSRVITVGAHWLPEKAFSEYDWVADKTANPNKCGYRFDLDEVTGKYTMSLFNSIQLGYMGL